MTKADWVVGAIIFCVLLFCLCLAKPVTYFLAGACAAMLVLVSLGKWASKAEAARREKAWKDYTEIISQAGKE